MSTDTLFALVGAAISEARPVAACADGSHHWKSEGSRRCPQDDDEEACGQAVYHCAICGAYDYGERGGPGFNDCATLCQLGHREAFAA